MLTISSADDGRRLSAPRDRRQPDGCVLQHTPPDGISFAGVGKQGRLVFIICEPFTAEQRASPEGFDYHLVVEVDRGGSLVSMRHEAEAIEIMSIDYGSLLACAYISHRSGYSATPVCTVLGSPAHTCHSRSCGQARARP